MHREGAHALDEQLQTANLFAWAGIFSKSQHREKKQNRKQFSHAGNCTAKHEILEAVTLEQVATLCGIATAGAAFFLWIVKMVVSASIHTAINGFETRLALIEQRNTQRDSDFSALHSYTHERWHEQIDGISTALVEAFKAGQETRKP